KRPARESGVDAKTRRPDLDDQLKALQNEAIEEYEAYRRSHEQLWKLLARAYLWWRDASREVGYLDSVYKQRSILHRTDRNRPNFNPLIRLVWKFENIGAAERVTISQWNKALQVMHERYLEKQQDFDHNPEGKLAALIQSRGGVSGLAASDASHKQGRRRTNNAGNDAVADEVARHALARLKTSKGIGTLTIKQPIRIGGGNLSVLLARRDASGPVAILGSSNDSNQIEAVA